MNSPAVDALRIDINGIVQGVGFRPFVYQLAAKYNLKGCVANTSEGVYIKAQGLKSDLDIFYSKITEEKPPLALITEITQKKIGQDEYQGFEIVKSDKNNSCQTLISPDVSICNDCLRELRDPADRRYGYPFINCTNCGPRYSIIIDIPYDRPKTSMASFIMCENCLEEYKNPLDRRFHAQPDCCPECGPEVFLYDNKRNKIDSKDVFKDAAKLLKQGKIVAVKGLGGFHLAADAFCDDAVKRLRTLKNRPAKPFALMCSELEVLKNFLYINDDEKAQLESQTRPVVILKKKKNRLISESVAPYNNDIGVMIAYTPMHYLIFDAGVEVLVMTSGNRRSEPIAIDNDEAFENLCSLADYFLIHNRDIFVRSDDSVIKNKDKGFIFFRRARGYVPIPVRLKSEYPEIIATGPELKNTVCLVKGKNAFVSQHIGDIKNPKAKAFFAETIEHMKKTFEANPEIIAHDMHPDYSSTEYAEAADIPVKIPVQHHHAHIVSCMADNGVTGKVIGIALDGAGYGTDGNIWGGEVILASETSFERKAHLAYIQMPGGDAASKDPWRMGLSYLYDAFGKDIFNLKIPFLENAGEEGGIEWSEKIRFITSMIDKDINCPLTSSMGRLFDGAAAITGICHSKTYAAQAAAEFEAIADNSVYNKNECYDYEIDGISINFRSVIRGIVKDIGKKISVSEISRKFHVTIANTFTEICKKERLSSGINKIAMSGGVFQNVLLSDLMEERLLNEGFEVYLHRLLPPNDGGLSLGQAVVAAEIVKGEKCH